MDEMQERGIVYVATGRKFVAEAMISVASAKKQMPDVSISLFTDLQDIVSNPPKGIDYAFLLKNVNNSCRDKIKPLVDAPYEKALFLDTDTYVCEPVYDVFEMLDRFDIALSQAPNRYQYDLPELPDCFTELNSGVIAYRNNTKTRELLQLWDTTFVEMLAKDPASSRDQHSLRDALYRSDIGFFVLPPEYNFRTIGPNFAGKNCKVKIIHGRHANIEAVAAKLNAELENRVFLSNPFRIWTHECSTYIGYFEAMSNFIFENLPKPFRNFLSGLRRR